MHYIEESKSYTELAKWRGRVLIRHGVRGDQNEFFLDQEQLVIVGYTPSEAHGGALINRVERVEAHFRETARRFMFIVESYYLELSNAVGKLHKSNVIAALKMASGVTWWLRRYVIGCEANPAIGASIALTVLDVVKLHLARVARDEHKLSATEIDTANHDMAIVMVKLARAISSECRKVRA